MSLKGNNAIVKTGRLLLLAGGATALGWSLMALWRDPPNFRFLLFLVAAVLVSWPRLRLPIRASEPLFFLSVLIFGPAAGIVISVAATAANARRYYRTRFPLFLLRIGISSLSAAIVGSLAAGAGWLESDPSGSSSSLINLLALLATVRFSMQADWSSFVDAIRSRRLLREFSRGHWLNSFLASFGAAFTAGVVLLLSKEQNPQVTLLSAVVIIIFYFAYRHLHTRAADGAPAVRSAAREKADPASVSHRRRRSDWITPVVTPAEEMYLEALRRARQEGSELLDLAQTLSSTLNLEEAISIIISRLSRLTTFDTYAIYVREDGLNNIYIAGAIGAYADELRMHQLSPGEGVIGRAVASGERAIDLPLGDEFVEFGEEITGAFKSITAIPLGRGGPIHGAIVLLSFAGNAYTGENQRVVDMVVPLAVDAVLNALTYRRTEASAVTDPLTGLANSRMLPIAFEEETNRAERYESKLAMLMIDLDGFKQINDRFGHLAGDDVLREVANCLKNQLRSSDKLIRYAGDEFIALLPHADEKSIGDLIARIQNHLESQIHLINGIEVRLGASIGYSILGRDGKSLDEMIKVADEGMYSNKSTRKLLVKPRRRKSPGKEEMAVA